MSETDYKRYECVICGFIYDEAEGLPDDGIAPGTRWEDLPEDWKCPCCGAGKHQFKPMAGSGSSHAGLSDCSDGPPVAVSSTTSP